MDIDKLIDYNLNLVFKAENNKLQLNYLENPIGRKISLITRAEEFARHLSDENLVTINGAYCIITRNGKNISENGGWLRHLEVEREKNEHEINKNSIEYDNLKLQKEVSLLTVENLKLQNRQMKRYVLYSIVGFVMGIVASNIKEIGHFIVNYFAHK